MLFLGILFPKKQESELIENSKAGVSNAANIFQWNILEGLADNLGTGIPILNVLPVGTFPRHYKKLCLPDLRWENHGKECFEIGCLNLPILKQIMRCFKLQRHLKDIPENEEILFCTAYLPFLAALAHVKRNVHVTAIITDLPEYYDMHQVSKIRKFLRKINNRLVYHYMRRIDRFILLTEQMAEPLQIGARPYMVMEGIYAPLTKDQILRVDKKHMVFMYAGRLNRRYGIGILLEAFSMIENNNMELWICGSGEMADEINTAAQTDTRIHFLGFCEHDKVLELQQRASVLINPRNSNGEYTKYSFPSKIMEYMGSGTPVLMYKLPGVPDQYDPYLIYIKGSGAKALRDAMRHVVSMTEAERYLIGQKAKKFVETQKSNAVQGKRILDFIYGPDAKRLKGECP